MVKFVHLQSARPPASSLAFSFSLKEKKPVLDFPPSLLRPTFLPRTHTPKNSSSLNRSGSHVCLYVFFSLTFNATENAKEGF